MKKQHLALPLALALGLTAFSVYTPANAGFDIYMRAIAIVFAFATKAMLDNTEKYFILVGYLFWTMAYSVMIYYGITQGRSTWPMVCGTYWVLNEFLVSFTGLFEPKTEHDVSSKYVTPLYVRIGYGVFLGFDAILNLLTIYYGTGDKYDELGLLPMGTLSERVSTFCLWSVFWSAVLVCLTRVFNPRQVKYFMYSFIYVSHVSALRLPIFADASTDVGLSLILKLQTLGSAVYVARFNSVTLPTPRAWFRVLMIGMPIFCAWTTTLMFQTVISMHVQTFAAGYAGWLTLFWVVATAMDSKLKTVEGSLVHPNAEAKVYASAPTRVQAH